jgi:hypothetical protein
MPAVVYRSTVASSGIPTTTNSKTAASLRKQKHQNLGRPIQLKLRNEQGQECVISSFQKESLAVVIEQYRSLVLPASAVITLHLDGEQLAPNMTPHSMDLDDDDIIIDVRVR